MLYYKWLYFYLYACIICTSTSNSIHHISKHETLYVHWNPLMDKLRNSREGNILQKWLHLPIVLTSREALSIVKPQTSQVLLFPFFGQMNQKSRFGWFEMWSNCTAECGMRTAEGMNQWGAFKWKMMKCGVIRDWRISVIEVCQVGPWEVLFEGCTWECNSPSKLSNPCSYPLPSSLMKISCCA